MKSNMLMAVSRSVHKAGFGLKKHSPEILVVAGTIGVIASAVMACRATTKLSGILEETNEQVDAIHDAMENEEYKETGKYTEEDGKKDLVIVYTQAGVKLVKLYGPAILLGAVSLGCMLYSNKILHKRNVALAAAYATIDKGFKEYRNRVVERFGDTMDRELKYNIKAQEIEETATDEEGNQKVTKRTVNTVKIDDCSDYARFFDASSDFFVKDPAYNLMFLKQAERIANDKLKQNGYLFLNDVYDMLDIPRTKAGQVVGWIYDEKNPIGDNYISFGIYEGVCPDSAKERFLEGCENVILLDFNVDGNIWDLM